MEVVLERAGRIGGLGRIESPLALVSINGERKLVVSPWAAIGTDVIGLGISGVLFFSSDNTAMKILAALGGLWMGTALFVESRKLLFNDEQRLIPEGM
jgi:hypothetical protein